MILSCRLLTFAIPSPCPNPWQGAERHCIFVAETLKQKRYMKTKSFLKLHLNLLHRPDHKWLLGRDGARRMGAYVLALIYLSSCEDGVASYESLSAMARFVRVSREVLRRMVEESGLFYVDRERGLFQSRYLCEVLSCRQRVGVVLEPSRCDESATQVQLSDAYLINRVREDIDIDIDKDKEGKEDGVAASFDHLLKKKERDREPEAVRALFADEALLHAVAVRVQYLICSPVNRPLVRRWLADYIRGRSYYRAHPLDKEAAALKLYELLRPGTATRKQFWEYMNRSKAAAASRTAVEDG